MLAHLFIYLLIFVDRAECTEVFVSFVVSVIPSNQSVHFDKGDKVFVQSFKEM